MRKSVVIISYELIETEFLRDDAFTVACVVNSQTAAPVQPTEGRGAKQAHGGPI